MPENKITLTIQQLCARLGIRGTECLIPNCKSPFTYRIEEHPKRSLNSYCENHGDLVILSVGDKIEMDKCECGHGNCEHATPDELSEPAKYLAGRLSCEKGCKKFKPLLVTVKAIRLVGRCECGHPETSHVKVDESVGQGAFCDDCNEDKGCNRLIDNGKYKPVQTVEITTKKKED